MKIEVEATLDVTSPGTFAWGATPDGKTLILQAHANGQRVRIFLAPEDADLACKMGIVALFSVQQAAAAQSAAQPSRLVVPR